MADNVLKLAGAPVIKQRIKVHVPDGWDIMKVIDAGIDAVHMQTHGSTDVIPQARQMYQKDALQLLVERRIIFVETPLDEVNRESAPDVSDEDGT